jgi:hypothetical protein
VKPLGVCTNPPLEFWNEATAIAIVGAIRPRAMYTPNGTTPSHLSEPRSNVVTRLGRVPEAMASGTAARVAGSAIG